MFSLVIPVYRNAANVDSLLEALRALRQQIEEELEVIFVVDGSPDDSYLRLKTSLPAQPFRSRLIALTRNFGAFSAIRAGIAVARGDRFGVMAADLQEPPELIVKFSKLLRDDQADVVVGQRVGRADPFHTRLPSALFWGLYRRLVQPEIPAGGVDVFGGNRKVRRQIRAMQEGHSSLVGLLFWIGFRRIAVPYERRARQHGKSAWSLTKKLRYLADSLFAFTDLPIRVLLGVGALGLLTGVGLGLTVLVSKLFFSIPVPGYAATVVTIVFFGGLNCFGLGVLGGYVWRTYENSKRRPNYIVMSREDFGDGQSDS